MLLIDKPKGMSSFGVVKAVRRRVPVRKVGHAGTLDPMATGLLITLVGRATKAQDRFMGQDKRYTGTIRLGQTTASYDAESPVEQSVDTSHLTDDIIRQAVLPFTGDIEQLPPAHSAIKVGGERLYKKARRGETVLLPPRHVRVDRFEVAPLQGSDVDFEIHCSKGTYIRSLAHDLGAALGVGAHLIALRRTAIGDQQVSDAWGFEALIDALETHA
ncbi:MAG: tRNA pseudouridine(55) synthase TruB [Rhodothermales bacterium]|nr:tRNA pseudouridine(55) synthase TruB [Rhodothermales bacterium]